MNENQRRVQLGQMVKTARLRKYGTVEDARAVAKISRGAWDHVEKGSSVKDFTLAAVERALDWPAGRCEEVLAGTYIGDVESAVEGSVLSDEAKAGIYAILEAERTKNEGRRSS